MASLLIFGGITLYEKYQSRRHSRLQKSSSTTSPADEFARLEKANADRIAALQQHTCFCDRSDWQGEGCAVHDREVFERGLREGMERVVELSSSGRGGEGEVPPPAYEGRRSGGDRGVRGDGEEDEERLVVPDVRHVMPPRYEDVHEGEKPCKRTLKERILRRKSGCAQRERMGKEGMVVR